MLVLSRKKNEGVVINDNIVVRVVDVRSGKVRLAIEAPRHMSVHREEVYMQIEKSQDLPSESCPSVEDWQQYSRACQGDGTVPLKHLWIHLAGCTACRGRLNFSVT